MCRKMFIINYTFINEVFFYLNYIYIYNNLDVFNLTAGCFYEIVFLIFVYLDVLFI